MVVVQKALNSEHDSDESLRCERTENNESEGAERRMKNSRFSEDGIFVLDGM